MAGSTVKIGVDVTQFKQGMAQAQQSAKTFQTQMKANEAQFKATGDREQYLTEKGRLLKQQLEAQKTAAANAEKALEAMRRNGVEKTSNEYQKMEQSLAGAQAAMYDTQAAMNTLATSEGKASSGAVELSNSLSGIGKKVSFDAVINGIDRITGGLEKAATKVIDIGQGIWNEMVKSAQWADDTATLALMYEVPLEELLKTQSLVANGLDTTVDAILGAQAKMRRGVGNGSIADDLDKIGVSMYKVIGYGKYGPITQLKESNELFWEAGQAIYNLGQEYDKEAIATAIFGKSWRELMPLFDKYKTFEEFKKARDSVNANTEDEVNALAELNDKLGELENNFDILKNKFLAELAPALTSASEVLSGLLTSLLDYLDTPEGKQALADLGTAVSGLFEDLKKIDPEEVVAGFAGVFNSIVGGFQWIVENQTLLEGILAAIVGGWAVAKITGGALTVLELVNGLITLKNTKKINIPQIDGNGGLGGGGSQTLASQDVTSQTVQSGTITSGTFNFTSGSTQTESVQTMYVQNMIGGPNGTPNVPTVPTGVPKVSGSDMVNLNAASGGALTSGTGYNLPDGGGYNLNAAGETLKIDAGSTRILLGDGTEIETAGSIRMDGMINAGTGKVVADGAFDAFGQQFAATHPLADKVINTVFSPQGLATLGVIAGIPLIAQASKYLDTRAAGVEKFGEGYKSLTHRQKQIADGNSPLDNGEYETIDDVKAAAERQKKIDKALTPEWLRWTVDLSDAVDNAADAVAGTAAEIYNIGKEAVNLPFEVLNAAIFGDSNKGQLAIDMAGMLLGGAAQNAGGLFGTVGKMADIVGDIAEKKAQTWAVEMAGTVAQDFINPMSQSINDIFAKTYQMFVQITPTGNTKFDFFSPTSGGGTTTWFSRLVGTTSSMHANGLPFVPYDNYVSILHRGERVLTARENQQYTFNNYFGSVNLNNGLEIEALTESIERRNRRQRSGYGAA